jgi:hypothetical protein
MGQAIGDVLPLAVGVALSPLPIVAVVLMLVTVRAKVNGPAFILGWCIGLAVIGQTGIPGGEQAVAYAVFVLVGTVGVGAPVVIFLAMGDRSRTTLDRLKGWMIHNNAVVMAVLCLVIGAKLVGDAISGFSA